VNDNQNEEKYPKAQRGGIGCFPVKSE
jgi:hypothetical protein